jgi:Sulfotransferase family
MLSKNSFLANALNLKSILKESKSLYESYIGTSYARKRHAREKQLNPTVEAAIQAIQRRFPDIKSDCESSPIFIFSAGWRSGSTLLQRLIMSSGKVIIWGEPYSYSGLIDHLSAPLKAITDKYPRSNWLIGNRNKTNPSDLADKWVANLYPDINYLHESHLNFLRNLFERSARENGLERWGIKEVRLTIDHAIYLNWLFPKAKFIFLYRNPYKAYQSYYGSYWYTEWPLKPVYTPRQFGEHWKSLVEGYFAGYQKVNGMLVKYEDLCNGNLDISHLEEFLGLKVERDLLKVKVGSSHAQQTKSTGKVPLAEMRILKQTVESLASRLNYEL